MTLKHGETPVMGLWGMCSAPSLPLLPGTLWPRVVVLVWAPFMNQIERFNHLTLCKQMADFKLSCLCYIVMLVTI